MIMNNWIEYLIPIIEDYKQGNNEPLDGDEVDRLCEIIKAKINLQEGNITKKEYITEDKNNIVFYSDGIFTLYKEKEYNW